VSVSLWVISKNNRRIIDYSLPIATRCCSPPRDSNRRMFLHNRSPRPTDPNAERQGPRRACSGSTKYKHILHGSQLRQQKITLNETQTPVFRSETRASHRGTVSVRACGPFKKNFRTRALQAPSPRYRARSFCRRTDAQQRKKTALLDESQD